MMLVCRRSLSAQFISAFFWYKINILEKSVYGCSCFLLMALFVCLATKLRAINPNKFNILNIWLQYSDVEVGRDQYWYKINILEKSVYGCSCFLLMALFVCLATKLRTINPNKFNILNIWLQYSDVEVGRDQYFSTSPKSLKLGAVASNRSLYTEEAGPHTHGSPGTGH